MKAVSGVSAQWKAREGIRRSNDRCHLEADVVLLIAQLLPTAGCTEALHPQPARAEQQRSGSRRSPRSVAGTRRQLCPNPSASSLGCVWLAA